MRNLLRSLQCLSGTFPSTTKNKKTLQFLSYQKLDSARASIAEIFHLYFKIYFKKMGLRNREVVQDLTQLAKMNALRVICPTEERQESGSAVCQIRRTGLEAKPQDYSSVAFRSSNPTRPTRRPAVRFRRHRAQVMEELRRAHQNRTDINRCSIHQRKRFKCVSCKKRYVTRRKYFAHFKFHKCKSPCLCPFCGHCFKSLDEFETHLRKANNQ